MSKPSEQAKSWILSFKCPDQLGVVARYSEIFLECGAFITEVSNYSDRVTDTFFLRCVFDDREPSFSHDAFMEKFLTLASDLKMEYILRPAETLPRLLLAVSKYDHCLNTLLTKWKAGAISADIVGVVSNHDDCRGIVEWYGLPYYHYPINKETKPQQEAEILALMDEQRVDLLVLARYMQILSDDMCKGLSGRAINIHHSFLPGFKGAKPYHQAYDRGVKVIGATAHYVTSDLDEGPIISQEVRPIDHQVSVEQMVHYGHDTEATALSHAVRLHCEQRVMLNGQRTVIL
jgi:formyltetrahydrofolate deformylase